MATVLFVVKATIRKDQEAAFNRWYNEEHRLLDSDHMKTLRSEYDAHFPDSQRARFGYVQVWP